MKYKCLIRTPAGFRQLVLGWTEALLQPNEFTYQEHELGFTSELTTEEIKTLLRFGPWYEDIMLALCYHIPVPHREYVPKHLKKLRSFFVDSKIQSIGLAVRIRHDSIHTVRRVREAFAAVVNHSPSKLESSSPSKQSSPGKQLEKTDIIVHGQDLPSQLEVLILIEKRKMDVWASLSGSGLYKRGNREVGGFLAPMREDLAACLLTMTMPKSDFYLWLPFAGSGTYYFETYGLAKGYEHPSYANLFAIEHQILDRLANFGITTKASTAAKTSLSIKKSSGLASSKAEINHSQPSVNKRLNSQSSVVDSSSSAHASARSLNASLMKGALLEDIHRETIDRLGKSLAAFSDENDLCELSEQDFFKTSDDRFSEKDIFLPINPPWGVRLGKSVDEKFFHNIGKKLQAFKSKSLRGFVLCPSEEASRAFLAGYKRPAEIFHFTQGGKHIRAVILSPDTAAT